MNEPVPTLYEWVGGQSALERLTTHFYAAVREDELLGAVFAHMHGEHPQYVAAFIGEVFGGPDTYSSLRGGHPHMVAQHLSAQRLPARCNRPSRVDGTCT